MPAVPIPRRELNTWLEIAAYLGVSGRTAQNWERTQGLPVHRLKGEKARVWAYTDELDAWRVSHQAATSTRRPWYWVTAAAGLLAAAALGVYFFTRPGPPVRVAAMGSTLVAFDRHDRRVWSFPLPVAPPRFEGTADPNPYDRLQALADIDGDGRVEFLYTYLVHTGSNKQVENANHVLCIGQDGRLRWSYTPKREVATVAGESLSAEWIPAYVAVLKTPRADGGRIVVVAIHRYSYPAQVAMLTPQGRLVAEYWHPGWLVSGKLFDLDGDGNEEILLGGVNNSYLHQRAEACLVVLDKDFRTGQSEPGPGDQHQLAGLPFVPEAALILLPKLPFPGPPGSTWFVDVIEAQGERISLRSSANMASTDSGTNLHYAFDRKLNLLGVIYDRSFAHLFAAGLLPPPPHTPLAEHVAHALRQVLTPRNRFAERR